jgi:hypothetical protein
MGIAVLNLCVLLYEFQLFEEYVHSKVSLEAYYCAQLLLQSDGCKSYFDYCISRIEIKMCCVQLKKDSQCVI